MARSVKWCSRNDPEDDPKTDPNRQETRKEVQGGLATEAACPRLARREHPGARASRTALAEIFRGLLYQVSFIVALSQDSTAYPVVHQVVRQICRLRCQESVLQLLYAVCRCLKIGDVT